MGRVRFGGLGAVLLVGCAGSGYASDHGSVTTVDLVPTNPPPAAQPADGLETLDVDASLAIEPTADAEAALALLDASMLDAVGRPRFSSEATLSAPMPSDPNVSLSILSGTGHGMGSLGGTGRSSLTSGGSGGIAGGLGSGSGSSRATINGKAPKDAVASDVEKTIQDAGCTPKAVSHPVISVFSVVCVDRAYEVSWVGASALSQAQRDALVNGAASSEDDGMLLAVRPTTNTDLARARALLQKVRVNPMDLPEVTVTVGGASVSGGQVSNASSVVAGMAAGFRRCYRRGLAEDPTMKGSLKLTLAVGPDGEVLGGSVSPSGTLGNTVSACVQARGSSAHFSPPEGGRAVIVVPVSFSSTAQVP